jgi:cation:H+ antiporter
VAAILVAGLRLTHYGHLLSQLTGLSGGWIGLMWVATVTSLPELVTGLSSVTVADAPDLAVGNVLGSCIFNLAMIGLVELLHRRQSLVGAAQASHQVAAASGLVMLTVVAAALWLSERGLLLSWGHISGASVLLVLLYALALRGCRGAQRGLTEGSPVIAVTPAGSLRFQSVVFGYALAAAVIVAAGLWLPLVGLRLATLMGWSSTLVGTVLMAAATTAPELATTLGALRLGAIDMVLGNLLGSNLFDLLILAIDDLAYLKGPLFQGRSPVHLFTLLTAMGMTSVVVWAMLPGSHRRAAGAVLLVFAAHLAVQLRLA